ncbi:hypothetical protein Q5752_002302 [Cryptotrichosporon argae]
MNRKRGKACERAKAPTQDPATDPAALQALLNGISGRSTRSLGRRILAATTYAGSSSDDAGYVYDPEADDQADDDDAPDSGPRASSRRSLDFSPSPTGVLPNVTGNVQRPLGPPSDGGQDTSWPLSLPEIAAAPTRSDWDFRGRPFTEMLADFVRGELFRRLGADLPVDEEELLVAHIVGRVAPVVNKTLLGLAASLPVSFRKDKRGRWPIEFEGALAVASMHAPDEAVLAATQRIGELLCPNPALRDRLLARAAHRKSAKPADELYATVPRKLMLSLAKAAQTGGEKRRAKRTKL